MTALIITILIAYASASTITIWWIDRRNRQLRDGLDEADLKRQRIVEPLITDRRRLERELEKLEQERDYYVDQINAIQCPDRIEVIDYGVYYEVCGFCDGSPESSQIRIYSYDPEDEFSKAYAKNLAEELVEKLQEQAF